jgi:hypothetical protein
MLRCNIPRVDWWILIFGHSSPFYFKVAKFIRTIILLLTTHCRPMLYISPRLTQEDPKLRPSASGIPNESIAR